MSTLNEKQKLAYNLMRNGKNIFITGGGGVGKVHRSYYQRFWQPSYGLRCTLVGIQSHNQRIASETWHQIRSQLDAQRF